MTRYLGIDPGLSGALAIVATVNGLPLLVDAIDMPSTGTGAKARVDVIAAAKWIGKHAPSAAYVERAQAFPGQGASSGFSYGRAVGALEAVVALCAIPMILVEASVWKRQLRLPGKDKEAARQRALQLFPSQHVAQLEDLRSARALVDFIAAQDWGVRRRTVREEKRPRSRRGGVDRAHGS
jgi:crossover junction endodeoxyribonuclease RuvC